MRKLILLTSLCVAFLSSGALAHHPFDAEYDRNKMVRLTGTVESLEWASPHATLHLMGRDTREKTDADWAVELGGPDELTRAGWTRETLKPGDKITVDGWMAKDGSKRANARAIRTAAGKTLMAASSFGASPGGDLAARDPQAAEPVGTSGQLPGTATLLPLAGLVGLLSLGAAVGLYTLRR
jgi:hypothetical protein